MENVFSPPVFPDTNGKVAIFLGGSIEMGNAVNWQESFIQKFKEKHAYARSTGRRGDLGTHSTTYPYLDKYIILNPRRPDWDESCKQSIDDPQFFQQVMWELEYLERADHRVFYFASDTLSPITLLELGTFHMHQNTYVCWEEGYKRQGNLEVYCHKYNIKQYKDIDSVISRIMEFERNDKNFYV